MSKPAIELSNSQIEALIVKTVDNFAYPPTPDIAGAVKQSLVTRRSRISGQTHRLAWATLIVLFIVAGLLAVPQVRAAVVEFLQLGAIRIFLVEPTPTATPHPSPTPITSSLDLAEGTTLTQAQTRTATPPSPTASPNTPPTATPRPSPTPTLIASLLDLAGETTLTEARTRVNFPIRLPVEPPDLGLPDSVFLQELGGPMVILIWLESDHPDQVRLSLHHFGANTFVGKVQPPVIQETTVHGERALWTEGPYLLQLRNGSYDARRLVEGNVLIWQEGEITYRLENNLSMEEAVRIAESLR